MSLRVRFSVLCVVVLAMPVFAAPPSGSDISGIYNSDVESPSNLVIVRQIKNPRSSLSDVTATYEPPQPCWDETITELFKEPTVRNGNSLVGTMYVCTG